MMATWKIAIWNLALVTVALLVLFPLAWMLYASVSPTGSALSSTATGDVISESLASREFSNVDRQAAGSWTLAHYRELFSRLQMGRFFFNSLLLSTAITVLALLFNAMAGYAFAKLIFPGRDRVFQLVVAVLVIPVQVAMLPLFMLLKELHLINSAWAVILPAAASAYGVFLVRQYALSLPDSLLDAARIDGAGELRIFTQLALPLIKPILIALGTFTFLGAWNDFMWPLIVLTDDDSYTLPVAMAILSGEHVQDVELMMAGAVVTALPVIVLFLAMQRHLIGGIVIGGVKE